MYTVRRNPVDVEILDAPCAITDLFGRQDVSASYRTQCSFSGIGFFAMIAGNPRKSLAD